MFFCLPHVYLCHSSGDKLGLPYRLCSGQVGILLGLSLMTIFRVCWISEWSGSGPVSCPYAGHLGVLLKSSVLVRMAMFSISLFLATLGVCCRYLFWYIWKVGIWSNFW